MDWWVKDAVRLFRSRLKKEPWKSFVDRYLRGLDNSRSFLKRPLSFRCCNRYGYPRQTYFHLRSYKHVTELYNKRQPWNELLIFPSPTEATIFVFPIDLKDPPVPLMIPEQHKGCFLTETGLIFFVISHEMRIFIPEVGNFMKYVLIKAGNPLTHLLACSVTEDFKRQNKYIEYQMDKSVTRIRCLYYGGL